jgi:predicted ABC-type ATPase
MGSGPRPTLTVIAGPNGSGKSTFTASARTQLDALIVDPDAIARELKPAAPEQAAVAGGREALKRQTTFLEQGTSFIVETTLAGNGPLRQMEQARQHGFDVGLYFIAIESVQTNIDRITERVAQGGHNVPERDVRRRYTRSMENLVKAVELADHATIIDNTLRQEPCIVLKISAGRIIAQAQDLPAWVTTYLGTFIAQQNQ